MVNERVIAVVPAAGSGRRFGEGTNKTFETLHGRPVLVWTLDALASVPRITEIIPVFKQADMETGEALIERYGIQKIKKIAVGGDERQDSVHNGLKLISDEDCVVLVHDGVRPLIEGTVVERAVSGLSGCDGTVAGVPVKDTIKEVSDGAVCRTFNRKTLWSVQTPQVFRFRTIFEAYKRAAEESFHATDDATLVERYGGRIRISEGSYMNIKITTPEDMAVAEVFLSMMRGRA